MSSNLDAIARRLQAARRVLFITGAGLSADSGLPTYRGIGGLYEAEDTDAGLPIEEADGFDLVFSIGTTSFFPYIARPFIDAHRAGLPTVEFNPTTSTTDGCSCATSTTPTPRLIPPLALLALLAWTTARRRR